MATNKKALAIKNYNISKMPEVVNMAKALKNLVVTQRLYTNIKGKSYVHVDGWQLAGGMIGYDPMVVDVVDMSTDKEIKYKTLVEILDKNGKVVSRGFAVCSNKESTKKGFDDYAVMSMSQTRAIGKAYRNKIGWIMKLAGYEGTPSEEMTKVGETPPSAPEETIIHTQEYSCRGVNGKGCAYGNDFINEATHNYSTKVFKKSLCIDCQKDAKNK